MKSHIMSTKSFILEGGNNLYLIQKTKIEIFEKLVKF